MPHLRIGVILVTLLFCSTVARSQVVSEWVNSLRTNPSISPQLSEGYVLTEDDINVLLKSISDPNENVVSYCAYFVGSKTLVPNKFIPALLERLAKEHSSKVSKYLVYSLTLYEQKNVLSMLLKNIPLFDTNGRWSLSELLSALKELKSMPAIYRDSLCVSLRSNKELASIARSYCPVVIEQKAFDSSLITKLYSNNPSISLSAAREINNWPDQKAKHIQRIYSIYKEGILAKSSDSYSLYTLRQDSLLRPKVIDEALKDSKLKQALLKSYISTKDSTFINSLHLSRQDSLALIQYQGLLWRYNSTAITNILKQALHSNLDRTEELKLISKMPEKILKELPTEEKKNIIELAAESMKKQWTGDELRIVARLGTSENVKEQVEIGKLFLNHSIKINNSFSALDFIYERDPATALVEAHKLLKNKKVDEKENVIRFLANHNDLFTGTTSLTELLNTIDSEFAPQIISYASDEQIAGARTKVADAIVYNLNHGPDYNVVDIIRRVDDSLLKTISEKASPFAVQQVLILLAEFDSIPRREFDAFDKGFPTYDDYVNEFIIDSFRGDSVRSINIMESIEDKFQNNNAIESIIYPLAVLPYDSTSVILNGIKDHLNSNGYNTDIILGNLSSLPFPKIYLNGVKQQISRRRELDPLTIDEIISYSRKLEHRDQVEILTRLDSLDSEGYVIESIDRYDLFNDLLPMIKTRLNEKDRNLREIACKKILEFNYLKNLSVSEQNTFYRTLLDCKMEDDPYGSLLRDRRHYKSFEYWPSSSRRIRRSRFASYEWSASYTASFQFYNEYGSRYRDRTILTQPPDPLKKYLTFSGYCELPNRSLLGKEDDNLIDVAKKLRDRLTNLGYESHAIKSSSGFAYITTVERITDDGLSFTGLDRFNKVIANPNSVWDYMLMLFNGKEGDYRSFMISLAAPGKQFPPQCTDQIPKENFEYFEKVNYYDPGWDNSFKSTPYSKMAVQICVFHFHVKDGVPRLICNQNGSGLTPGLHVKQAKLFD